MSTRNIVLIAIVAIIVLLGGCAGCNYNSMNRLKQEVSESWSNVENQYKRRSDLIGNLVNTVKGAANFEQETLTKVIEARSKATSLRVDPSDLSPEKLKEFQAAQGELSQALGRLIMITENYPELKANQNFLNLQTELTNTENKIATERSRFNEKVKNYNTVISNFPNVIYSGLLGFKPRGYFEATETEKETPKVDFSK
ncbi:MAG: LemA family protein [Sphingobacteriales bacterium]|jgi:LemA protein|nr:MAG: LemA family protein [Sphingobacteriales bacterium]